MRGTGRAQPISGVAGHATGRRRKKLPLLKELNNGGLALGGADAPALPRDIPHLVPHGRW